VYRVGLTGNIASGKSAVADEWARLGVALIDADELARAAVAPGTAALERVRAEFGAGMIADDGSLDRAALRHVVFSDQEKRGRLEGILHPEIARLRDEKEAALREAGRDVVAHVIPLLFEVGLHGSFDALVLVDSPETVRRDRLVRLRGIDEDEARRMIEAQMPAERKRAILRDSPALALVIENEGTLDELRERAREAWRTIERAALER
jgi:dephospho-CoA kinase